MMKVNTTCLRESSAQLRQLAKRIDHVLEQMAEIRRRLYDSCEMGGQLPEQIRRDYFKLGHQYDTLLELANVLSEVAAQYERCERRNQMNWQDRMIDDWKERIWRRWRQTHCPGVLVIPEWARRIFYRRPARWKKVLETSVIVAVECSETYQNLGLNRILVVGSPQE